MSCNQKTSSSIVKAATVYLGGGVGGGVGGGGQGKKSLLGGSRASTIFAGEDGDHHHHHHQHQIHHHQHRAGDSSFVLPLGRAAGLFPSELAEITERKKGGGAAADGVAVWDGKRRADDAAVEILGLPEAEGLKNDREERVSECSSSFGFSDAGSGDEADAAGEVESASREGNGNGSLETERKRPLNMDWKNYRRGIEWRCRWLDIRLMELQRQATKYDKVLSGIQNAKPWDGRTESDGGAARTAPVREDRTAPPPLLQRKRRRKVEETADVAEYMSKHPMFQRYEKRKRESDGNSHKEPGDNALATEGGAAVRLAPEENEDSVENVMLKVETLQARVVRLRNQLRGSMSHKLPGQVARAGGAAAAAAAAGRTPASKAAAVRLGRAAQGGNPASPGAAKAAQAARRRSSDYDINNVVMPVSAGAKYVQHVRHANIKTPQWRLAPKAEEQGCEEEDDDDDDDDEDTDDEAYRSRHAPLEAQERLNRYGPRAARKVAEASARSSGSHQMPQCSLSAQYSEG